MTVYGLRGSFSWNCQHRARERKKKKRLISSSCSSEGTRPGSSLSLHQVSQPQKVTVTSVQTLTVASPLLPFAASLSSSLIRSIRSDQWFRQKEKEAEITLIKVEEWVISVWTELMKPSVCGPTLSTHTHSFYLWPDEVYSKGTELPWCEVWTK